MKKAKHYTVCSHKSVYGEGIPQSEADAISHAVARALRRRFPGLRVDVRRCRQDTGVGDSRVKAWVDKKWDDNPYDSVQSYTPERVVEWWDRQK